MIGEGTEKARYALPPWDGKGAHHQEYHVHYELGEVAIEHQEAAFEEGLLSRQNRACHPGVGVVLREEEL